VTLYLQVGELTWLAKGSIFNRVSW